MVESTGLENRRTLTGLVGSNPTLPVLHDGEPGHDGEAPRMTFLPDFYPLARSGDSHTEQRMLRSDAAPTAAAASSPVD